MIDYVKTILEKTSFDAVLFWREFTKTQRYLTAEEQVELHKWLHSQLQVEGSFIARMKSMEQPVAR